VSDVSLDGVISDKNLQCEWEWDGIRAI